MKASMMRPQKFKAGFSKLEMVRNERSGIFTLASELFTGTKSINQHVFEFVDLLLCGYVYETGFQPMRVRKRYSPSGRYNMRRISQYGSSSLKSRL
jgi:hypothetical protein